MNTPSAALPVIVIGSGIAGLTTALALAPRKVLLITKAGLGQQTSSAWAQGGIAAAVGPDDSAELHLSDTLAAGDGLVDEEAARSILTRAADAIHWLERQGAQFDRTSDGEFSLGLEAAHCRRRIVHASGDASGASVVNALIRQVLDTPSITVMAGAQAQRLTVAEGRVVGVEIAAGGSTETLLGSAVVLATGGIGGLYEATTNPTGNFGQGIALAARAGAALADMEFVQFHPTALASPRTPLALISEAVRGEGAQLRNERGERFMADVPGAELAPRDVWRVPSARKLPVAGACSLMRDQPLETASRPVFPVSPRSARMRHRSCPRGNPRPPRCSLPHGRRGHRSCRTNQGGRSVGRGRSGGNRPAWRKPAGQQFAARSNSDGACSGKRHRPHHAASGTGLSGTSRAPARASTRCEPSRIGFPQSRRAAA